MNEKIKDDFEERFANNDTYRAAGREYDNITVPVMTDTSDEGVAECRKRATYLKGYKHYHKILIATDSNTNEYNKDRLYGSFPQPMKDEIKAKAKSESFYQLSETLEDFRWKRNAVTSDRNLRASLISPEKQKEYEENGEVQIFIKTLYVSIGFKIRYDEKWFKFKKTEAEKVSIDEECLRFYDEIIAALEQEVNDRANADIVKKILENEKKLNVDYATTVKKVRQSALECRKKLDSKNTKTFIEGQKRLNVIEYEHRQLKDELEMHLSMEEAQKILPPLPAGLSIEDLHDQEAIKKFYEKELREASKKA